mgnify:CR=1 FL=1
MAFDLADIVDTADVGVGHLERTSHLVEKALEAIAILIHFARQKLERHRLPELEVVGAIDLTHAAAAEQPDNTISPIDNRARDETLRLGSRSRIHMRRTAVHPALGHRRRCDVERLSARWTVFTAIRRLEATLWAEHCNVMLTRPSRDVKGAHIMSGTAGNIGAECQPAGIRSGKTKGAAYEIKNLSVPGEAMEVHLRDHFEGEQGFGEFKCTRRAP